MLETDCPSSVQIRTNTQGYSREGINKKWKEHESHPWKIVPIQSIQWEQYLYTDLPCNLILDSKALSNLPKRKIVSVMRKSSSVSSIQRGRTRACTSVLFSIHATRWSFYLEVLLLLYRVFLDNTVLEEKYLYVFSPLPLPGTAKYGEPYLLKNIT